MCPPLQSALFQSARLHGDTRLDDVANGTLVLRRWQAQGFAVQLLQRALQQLGKLDVHSDSFRRIGADGQTPDGIFGGETFTAVQAFQRSPGPGLPPLAPDGEVGKLTLCAIDSRLPRGAPPAAPPAVPPHQLFSRGGCGTGLDFTHSDFDPADLPPHQRDIVGPFLTLPDLVLETILRTAFVTKGGEEGRVGFDHWVSGNGTPVTHGPGTPISELAKRGATLRSILTPVQENIVKQLRQQAALGRIDFQAMTIADKIVPAGLEFTEPGDGAVLFVLIKGVQGLKIDIKDYSAQTAARTYRATLVFDFCDDFAYGRDNDIVAIPVEPGALADAVARAHTGDLSPLQRLMQAAGPPVVKTLSWILQHDRSDHVLFTRGNRQGRYKPYVLRVVAEVPITGSF